MGKWSFINVTLSDKFKEELDKVHEMSDNAVNEEWRSLGCPILANYGLDWYAGVSGDGWACIDNSASPDKETNPFQMFCNKEDITGHDMIRFWRLSRRACILAARMGIAHRPEAL